LLLVPQNLVMLGVGLVAMAALHLFFGRSLIGQALRATAENPVAAQLMGIRTDRMMMLTFALSGFLAGGAGVLVASIVYANFDLGLIGVKAFAAAVLGGFGHVGGAMVGGLVLGVLETMGAFYVSSAFKDLISYSVLILILLVRPHGLFGAGVGRPE
jgi:branched-chain amino acid transport system permease protein